VQTDTARPRRPPKVAKYRLTLYLYSNFIPARARRFYKITFKLLISRGYTVFNLNDRGRYLSHNGIKPHLIPSSDFNLNHYNIILLFMDSERGSNVIRYGRNFIFFFAFSFTHIMLSETRVRYNLDVYVFKLFIFCRPGYTICTTLATGWRQLHHFIMF